MQIEGIDIIQNIENFYDSAWNKLIFTGTVALGIIGVLIPIIIQWWQKKILNLEKNKLKEELRNELSLEFKELYVKKFKKLKREHRIDLESLKGMTFHLQGNKLVDEGYIKGAIADFITSAILYSRGKKHGNLVRVLNNLIRNLEDFPKEDFENLIESEEINLKKFFKRLIKNDKKGALGDLIQDLKDKIKKLKTIDEIKLKETEGE